RVIFGVRLLVRSGFRLGRERSFVLFGLSQENDGRINPGVFKVRLGPQLDLPKSLANLVHLPVASPFSCKPRKKRSHGLASLATLAHVISNVFQLVRDVGRHSALLYVTLARL